MKIEYTIKGITLNESELCELHEYYEAACTAEYLIDNYGVDEKRALDYGYEVRRHMRNWGGEEDEVIRTMISDGEIVVMTYKFYVKESNCTLEFQFAKKYDKEKVLDNIMKFYHQWQHPENEEKEVADEIKNSAPDEWIIDHMYDDTDLNIVNIDYVEEQEA